MPKARTGKLSKAQRQAADAAANAFSDHLLKVARPLFWHAGVDKGGALRGATAFVLQFEQRLVAVTADHVMQEYLDTIRANNEMLCQFGPVRIWPEKTIIARSKSLDIATFEITEKELKDSATIPVDCRGAGWPVPDIMEGDTISMSGFLDEHRVKYGPRHYELRAWGAHGIAARVTSRDVVTVYEPDRVHAPRSDIPMPPLGFNMSGCSGAPVFLIKTIKGLFRWHVIGLIYQGPKGKAEGELAGSDRIYIRRIHFLNSDGTINEPDTGWLPN
jgi:hypothetical protein